MNTEERALITDLFDRLATAAAQPRDPDAEALIRARLAENTAAPYYLAQSALVFQQATQSAQTRITALESELAQSRAQAAQPARAGFLSGIGSLFDGRHEEPARSTPPPLPPQAAPYSTPQGTPNYAPQPAVGRGGGFLQTALGTAAGVAGGALLFQGIENLLGHNPGPFGGAAIPSGGFLGQTQPGENVEIINNNYYGNDDLTTSPADLAGQPGNDASDDPINLFADSPNDDFNLGDDSFLNGVNDDLNS